MSMQGVRWKKERGDVVSTRMFTKFDLTILFLKYRHHALGLSCFQIAALVFSYWGIYIEVSTVAQ